MDRNHRPSITRAYDDTAGPEREIISEEKTLEKERTKLAQEEAAIESKIVECITSGQWQSLRPNSGVSVEIRGSHLCVDYHEEVGYRVWEWHGHCMIYGENGDGYTPEYMYGNYFEPLVEEEEVSRPVGLGLTALNRRVVPGLGGVIGALERPGSLPMRNILGEAYRRASK